MATDFSYRTKAPVFSDSDSDDSDKECLNWKRVTKNATEAPEKVPIVPSPAEPPETITSNAPKRKRNTIWAEVLQDQIMSETLTHCGIKSKPRGYGERGAESYDYRVGKRAYEEDDSDQDQEMSEDSRPKPHKRFKNDKFVELEPDGVKVALEIVKELQEGKKYLIFRIVKHLGVDKALEFLKKTQDIEENGGMMIKSQERRRTPGGVYMQLIRSDPEIDKEALDKIFEGELNSYDRKRKFAEMRKKRKGKKKNKASKEIKGSMEFDCLPIKEEHPSSSDEKPTGTTEIADSEKMEEDTVGNFCLDSIKKEESDLEEGEIE